MKDSYVFYTDQLTGEYKEAFEQIELFMTTQRTKKEWKESQMSELLDIFLNAQERNKPVARIVGKNIEQFCKHFCVDNSWKNKFFYYMDWLKGIAWFLFVMTVLELFGILADVSYGETVDFWNMRGELNLSAYLIGLLICTLSGSATDYLVSKIMFRLKRLSVEVLRGIIIGVTVLIVLGVFLPGMYELETVDWWTPPIWITFLGTGLYLVLYYLLNRKRKKENKEHKIYLSSMINEGLKDMLSEEMQKKYDKMNQKQIRKGREPLTWEAFLDKEEKNCERNERLVWFYYLFPVVITGIVTFWMCQNDGFENFADGLWFVGILLLVEYAVILGLWKMVKVGIEPHREWIFKEREKQAEEKLS